MSLALHAILGVALVAVAVYLGQREYYFAAALLLFAGMVVMDFFRQRVLTHARSRGQKNKASESDSRSDGA